MVVGLGLFDLSAFALPPVIPKRWNVESTSWWADSDPTPRLLTRWRAETIGYQVSTNLIAVAYRRGDLLQYKNEIVRLKAYLHQRGNLRWAPAS